MTRESAPETDLHHGDSGDAVLHLQTRLHALGHYDGAHDGYFGDATAAAVLRFAESRGVAATDGVDPAFWLALAEAEREAGIAGHPADDQQWQWDGDRWQYAAEAAPVDPSIDMNSEAARGQWVWDGTQWQPVV